MGVVGVERKGRIDGGGKEKALEQRKQVKEKKQRESKGRPTTTPWRGEKAER